MVEPPIRATGGQVPVLFAPGLDHEVDESLVRDLATATLTL